MMLFLSYWFPFCPSLKPREVIILLGAQHLTEFQLLGMQNAVSQLTPNHGMCFCSKSSEDLLQDHMDLTFAERWTVRKCVWRFGNFPQLLRHMRWLWSLRQTRTRQRTYLVDFSVFCLQFNAIMTWFGEPTWPVGKFMQIHNVLMFWFILIQAIWSKVEFPVSEVLLSDQF